MNFINSGVFWLLPLILAAMILIYWWSTVRRGRLLSLILGPRAKDPEHVRVNYARRNLRFFILCLAIVFLVIAAARPWWRMSIVPYEAKGRDLMVLFDVSQSMLAEDIKPSRLEHSKWLVRQLVAETAGNRYGLVAFAGEAFLECPLTRDMSSFVQYLDELSTNSIPLPGTNLQRALEVASRAFQSAEGDNRAIILITDGEELEGNSTNVINELKSRNIPLFIVGLGDPGTPALIPIYENGVKTSSFKRDSKGELVKTTLNEPQMISLSQAIPGSIYIRSTTTSPGLDALNSKINALASKELDGGMRTRPIERFQYFIAGALALLALYMLLSERGIFAVRKSMLVLILSVAITLPLAAEETEEALPATPPPQENKEEPPAITDPIMLYNQGRELQLEKKDGADQLYEKSINNAENKPVVRNRAFQNLGVFYHEKARSALVNANSEMAQNLDNADKTLANSQQLLTQAEEFYLRSMTENSSDEQASTAFAINQQLMLRDRKITEELRSDIKEYKEQHQNAIKNLEEAVAAPTPTRPDKSAKARQSVKRLHELAEKLRQQQMTQDAGEAGEEIEKALKVISSNDQEAVKHLEKALEILKKKDENKQDQQNQDQDKKDQQDQDKKDQNKQDQDKKDQQDKQDQDKQDQNKQDQQDQDKKDQQDKQDQNKQDQQPQPQKPEERKIDPQQAKNLLEQMAKDEKNLRDALKEERLKNSKNIQVEKDW